MQTCRPIEGQAGRHTQKIITVFELQKRCNSTDDWLSVQRQVAVQIGWLACQIWPYSAKKTRYINKIMQ